MSREVHVRFWESAAVQSRRATHPLIDETKRKILSLNSARLHKLEPEAPVVAAGPYKPVPTDYASLVPQDLKETLADTPGAHQGPTQGLWLPPRPDKLALLRNGYFLYATTVEEGHMTTRFPDVYPAYRRRTKMLIPFLL